MSEHTTINNNPNLQVKEEMEVKTGITDFEIETTPTSIQYVAKREPKNTQSQSSGTLLPNTNDKNPHFEMNNEREIKTEIIELEPDKTASQNDLNKTEDDIFTKKIAQNQSQMLLGLLLNSEIKNPDFKIKEEIEVKTNITDFEIETTATSVQYIDKETVKLSPDKKIELKRKNGKNSEKVYKCLTCNIGFYRLENYEKHMLCHPLIPDSGPSCSMCDVTFATEQGFILHCRITHDELKPIQNINEAEEKQITLDAVQVEDIDRPVEATAEHIKHEWEKPTLHTYDIENSLIESIDTESDCKISLLNSANNFNSPTSFKCDSCTYVSDTECDLANHIIRVHTLEIHYRTYTKVKPKPYTCEVCGKRFTQKGSLKKHERKHLEGDPYKCSICEKTFTHKPHLVRHERTHTGDKPFMCNVCDRRFADVSSLKTHELTHNGDMPFKCKMCDKRFVKNYHLKTHKGVHREDKFKCIVCDRIFTDKACLKKHEKTHNNK